jgi:hypothetical protein
MDALKEKLQDLIPHVKLKAMSIESWINYKQVENSIRQKEVEHDLFLEKVTSRYGIKMSEWRGYIF